MQMAKRSNDRYKGSILRLTWSFFNPLFMLSVYTFFSVVFKAVEVEPSENKADFALILFIGLIIHALFAEVLIRAQELILRITNYVKSNISIRNTYSC